MDFSQTLESLSKADLPLKPAALYNLSRLEPDEIERLAAIWAAIPATRRRTLVRELVEIAEANFEVNFDPVFDWGLRDSDPEVRAISIEGLWENKALTLTNELLHLLQNDPAVQVRAAAATSLGRFLLLGELGQLPAKRCRPVYDVLLNLIRKGADDLQVRRRAIESVACVSHPEIIDLLKDAYDHPEEKMRISAVFGMGRSADTRWISTVTGELFSTYPEMRYEAARACGELEVRSAVPRLVELVDDPDREVQQAALWALGQAGGDKARTFLQTCCTEGNEIIRSTAEAALAELEFIHGQIDFSLYALDDIQPDSSS